MVRIGSLDVTLITANSGMWTDCSGYPASLLSISAPTSQIKQIKRTSTKQGTYLHIVHIELKCEEFNRLSFCGCCGYWPATSPLPLHIPAARNDELALSNSWIGFKMSCLHASGKELTWMFLVLKWLALSFLTRSNLMDAGNTRGIRLISRSATLSMLRARSLSPHFHALPRIRDLYKSP